jgi:GDP-L-fucose synthase
MKSILVTGSNGYIASSFIKRFSKKYQITSINRSNFDLTNTKETNEFFEKQYFDVVIHTAIAGGSRLVPDVEQNTFKNLLMFDNLIQNKHKFTKFISFGSGAEIYYPTTPYGLSKKIINNLILNIDSAYNLRIFAVFDENELSTRFIKNNILKCINNQTPEIHYNRLFDFFYMGDLLKVIDYYINASRLHNLPKIYECCYANKPSLVDIANYIRKVFHQTPIENTEPISDDVYVGNFATLPIEYTGLYEGIKQTCDRILKNCQ